MKRNILIGIGIVVVVALAVVLIVTQTKKEPEIIKKEPEEIKIGAILPLTGPAGYIGERLKNGMEVALEQIRMQDELPVVLEMRYEDSMNDPKTGVSAFRKLINDKVDIVVCAMSSVTKSVIPLANQNETPFLVTSVSAEGIAAQGDCIFRFFTKAEIDAKAMAIYAYDELNLRKIAIIHVQDDFGISYAQIFKRFFEERGGSVILVENFNPGETDFLSPLTKIKASSPDGIYIVSYSNNLALIPKQIKELGINVTILGTGTIGQQFVIDQAGGSLEGAYYTANEFNTFSPTTPEMKNFVEFYQKKYGEIPEYFEVFGYDLINLVIEAIKKEGPTKKGICNGLLSIQDFKGAVGKISISSDGEVDFPVVIKKVVEGKPSPPIFRYDPSEREKKRKGGEIK